MQSLLPRFGSSVFGVGFALVISRSNDVSSPTGIDVVHRIPGGYPTSNLLPSGSPKTTLPETLVLSGPSAVLTSLPFIFSRVAFKNSFSKQPLLTDLPPMRKAIPIELFLAMLDVVSSRESEAAIIQNNFLLAFACIGASSVPFPLEFRNALPHVPYSALIKNPGVLFWVYLRQCTTLGNIAVPRQDGLSAMSQAGLSVGLGCAGAIFNTLISRNLAQIEGSTLPPIMDPKSLRVFLPVLLAQGFFRGAMGWFIGAIDDGTHTFYKNYTDPGA